MLFSSRLLGRKCVRVIGFEWVDSDSGALGRFLEPVKDLLRKASGFPRVLHSEVVLAPIDCLAWIAWIK